MIAEYRLRKFGTTEMDGELVPRLVWVKYFKTETLAKEFAIVESPIEVLWIGDAALSEEYTYDVKRIEVSG